VTPFHDDIPGVVSRSEIARAGACLHHIVFLHTRTLAEDAHLSSVLLAGMTGAVFFCSIP